MKRTIELSEVDEAGRESYVSVADETHGFPGESTLTLDDLAVWMLDEAKAFAAKYDLQWPPPDVDTALEEIRVALRRRAELADELRERREEREERRRRATRKERRLGGFDD